MFWASWLVTSKCLFVSLSASGYLNRCVIPVSREFTHDCSRSTQPSHPYAGRQKIKSSYALRQLLIRSLGSLAPSQETYSVSWCQAEGYGKGRPAPTQLALRILRVVVVVVANKMISVALQMERSALFSQQTRKNRRRRLVWIACIMHHHARVQRKIKHGTDSQSVSHSVT